MQRYDRRDLLKTAGLMVSGGLLNAVAGFPLHAANVSGYRALVCVFLRGGADCHDMLLPYDQTSYNRYAEIRRSLLEDYRRNAGGSTRTRDRLLPLTQRNGADFAGRAFALPPEMAPIHSLFTNERAAIVANVGPLITPINRTAYRNRTSPSPRRLFSHNDQQSTWSALKPEGEQIGWGGRFADAAVNSNANLFPSFSAISVTGNDVFLAGSRAVQYQLGSGGAATIREMSNRSLLGSGRNSTTAQSLVDAHFRGDGPSRTNLFERDIMTVSRRAIEANSRFNNARATARPLTTVFPDTNLGRQLRTIAETIALRDTLGASRQVFFSAIGGFDTHSDQARTMPGLQRQIADAVAAFYAATEELGVAGSTTLFTASEFGRTLTINGDGTDHGWGGHHIVVGGAVNGGNILGDPPPFDVDHAQDSGRGRLIPTTSVEQFAAPLGRWFGLTEAELRTALPLLPAFGPPPLMI